MIRKNTNSDNKFLNRELSWLLFNQRVLDEANDAKVPLIERVNFLSISASNLDEFYMVRIPSLLDEIENNPNKTSHDGMTGHQQLKAAQNASAKIFKNQDVSFRKLVRELNAEKIIHITPNKLNIRLKKNLKKLFNEEILPILTPISIDPVHPFPFIPNEGLCISLSLVAGGSNKPFNSVIIVPRALNRLVFIQEGKKEYYLFVEDIIRYFFKDLFPNSKLLDSAIFRVIRDSDIDYEYDDDEDVVKYFEKALTKRKRGEIVRLEILKNISSKKKNFLKKNLNLKDAQVIALSKHVGLQDLSQIHNLNRPKLKFKKFISRPVERLKQFDNNCFAAIRSKDFVVHHPYETFDVVVDYLNQAAADPKVVAIKQTIYRTTADSPIIKALTKAADNGKSVTAVVEIKARFDEESNLALANQMEKSGVQIVYGFAQLKTHAKASLIIRREAGKLKSYVHVGTGNYHPKNAKTYEDLSLFTADEKICKDIERIFNYMTGYASPIKLNDIVLSPPAMRNQINVMIDNEIKNAKKSKPSGIWLKMNSLVDPQMISKLYEASAAGVKIELFIRGICCLRPGVKKLSENIVVKSIIGRYLEHARIFCFANESNIPSKNNTVLIGSADLMPRNLDRRVEILTPIKNSTVHEQILNQIMVANFLDNEQTWMMNDDGTYKRVKQKGKTFNAHKYFMSNPSLSGRGKLKGNKKPKKLLSLMRYE